MTRRRSQGRQRFASRLTGVAVAIACTALVAAVVLDEGRGQGRATSVDQAPAPQPAAAPAPSLSTPGPVDKASPVVATPSGQSHEPLVGPGQRAYIDPATGRLREAEPEERLAEAAADAARRAARSRNRQAAAVPQEFQGPGGAVGVAVPEDLLTYSVATVGADGKVVIEHATGPKAADGQVRAGRVAQGRQKKGEPNDH